MHLAEARIRIASRDTLPRELGEAVGPAYVRSEPGDLLAYEDDASNIAAVPDLAVLPGSAEEVARVLRIAARHRVPVVPPRRRPGSQTGRCRSLAAWSS